MKARSTKAIAMLTCAVLFFSMAIVANFFEIFNGDAATSGIFNYVILEDNTLEVSITPSAKATQLGKVVVPEEINGMAVTAIREWGFASTNNITEVVLPETITSIGASAFRDCTGLVSINLPSSLTFLGVLSFHKCTSLKKIVIPAAITEIPSEAFLGCESLGEVIFAGPVTQIGSRSFQNCEALESIIIPETVTSILGTAFWDCTGLKHMIMKPVNPPTYGSDCIRRSYGLTLYIPAGSMSAYKAAPGWNEMGTINNTNILVETPYVNQPQMEYASLREALLSNIKAYKISDKDSYSTESWSEITETRNLAIYDITNAVYPDDIQQIYDDAISIIDAIRTIEQIEESENALADLKVQLIANLTEYKNIVEYSTYNQTVIANIKSLAIEEIENAVTDIIANSVYNAAIEAIDEVKTLSQEEQAAFVELKNTLTENLMNYKNDTVYSESNQSIINSLKNQFAGDIASATSAAEANQKYADAILAIDKIKTQQQEESGVLDALKATLIENLTNYKKDAVYSSSNQAIVDATKEQAITEIQSAMSAEGANQKYADAVIIIDTIETESDENVDDNSNTLDEYKADAIQRIQAYKANEQYSEPNMHQVSIIKTNAINAINESNSEEAIDSLYDAAVLAIDAIVDESETETEDTGTYNLTDYKQQKEKELYDFKRSEELMYSETDWSEILEIKTEAYADIDYATTIAEIDEAIAIAKEAITQYRTRVEIIEEIFESLFPIEGKEKEIEDARNLYNELTDAQKEKVENYNMLLEAERLIEADNDFDITMFLFLGAGTIFFVLFLLFMVNKKSKKKTA